MWDPLGKLGFLLEFKYYLEIILGQTFDDIFSIVADFLVTQSWFLIELSTLQRIDHYLLWIYTSSACLPVQALWSSWFIVLLPWSKSSIVISSFKS